MTANTRSPDIAKPPQEAPVSARLPVHLTAGLLILSLTLGIEIASGWSIQDESWFLQVAHRFASGEVLYRDVFFHVTPLSLYLFGSLTNVFGAEIIVLKVALAMVFTGIVLVTCRINEQLGSKERYPPFLLLALIVFSSPATMHLISFYSELANLFLLVAFSLFLSWWRIPSTARLLSIGCALGLCFATKQNAGLYGCLALAFALAAHGWAKGGGIRRVVKEIGVAAGAFLLTSVVTLVPVMVSGGLPGLADYGFFGLHSILNDGALSYWRNFAPLRAVLAGDLDLSAIMRLAWPILYSLPVVAAAILAVEMLTGPRDRRAISIGVAAFAAAALAPVFPRSDPSHMIVATPLIIVAIAFGWRHLWPERLDGLSLVARTAVFLFTVPSLMLMSVNWLLPFNSGGLVWSDIPHFHGSLISRDEYSSLQSTVRNLETLPRDGRTLFLSPRAAFYYLATGMKNPTSFDYPGSSGFGAKGMHEVENAIKRGDIQYVCIQQWTDRTFTPYQLEDFVRTNMIPAKGPSECRTYTNPNPLR